MFDNSNQRWLAASVTYALLGAGSAAAALPCLEVPGDLNDSGTVNVADAVCSALVLLDELGGGAGPDPSCLAHPRAHTDINCDDAIAVGDVQLVIGLAIGAGLPSLVDADDDQCADLCPLTVGCVPIGETLHFDSANESNAQAKWQGMMTVTFAQSVNATTLSYQPYARFTDDHASGPALAYAAYIDVPVGTAPLELDYHIEGTSMEDAAFFVYWEDSVGGFHDIQCNQNSFPGSGDFTAAALAQVPYTCPSQSGDYTYTNTAALPTAFTPVRLHLRVFVYAVPNGDTLDIRRFGLQEQAGTECVAGLTCLDIRDTPANYGSGEYLIDPDGEGGEEPFYTYCDMTTDGGGWTQLGYSSNAASVADKSVSQNGNWSTYTQTGYGAPGVSASTVFWVALQHWHTLTAQFPNNVWRVVDPGHEMRMSNLNISDAATEYILDYAGAVGGYGQLLQGQSPGAVKGMRFTTWDNDNDTWGTNCAKDNVGYNGGFWYTACWQNSMVHADGTVRSWYINGDPSNPAVAWLGLWFREN